MVAIAQPRLPPSQSLLLALQDNSTDPMKFTASPTEKVGQQGIVLRHLTITYQRRKPVYKRPRA
jgi:hypothetical protein